MAKIYGSTTATPIKPDVFVNNKPTIYEGTIINSFDASTTGGIFNKGAYAFGGNTVSEFWLNLKVGDLYYNTDEKKTYLCLSVSVDDNKARADATWKDLNVKPDEVYNPESANAQSGKAVSELELKIPIVDQTFTMGSPNAQSGKALAEMYGMLTDDFVQADWQFWNTIGKAYVDEKVGSIETALDSIIAEQESIIAMQNSLIGGVK